MYENKELKYFWAFTFVMALYIYLKYYVYNYWKRFDIPHENPSIPFGNIPFSYFNGKITLGDIVTRNYNKFKQYPFHGFYVLHRPVIMINDPKLIQTIFIKEFSSFENRGWYSNKKLDPLSNNLFLQDAETWKYFRHKLSVNFTPAKIKKIFTVMSEMSTELINFCDTEIEKNNILDIKNICERFMINVISSAVYGINCNCLKNPNDDFRLYALKALNWGNTKTVLNAFIPKVIEILGLSFYNKESINFFSNVFKEIADYRKKNPVNQNDVMAQLLQLLDHDNLETEEKSSNKNQDYEEKILELTGQAFILFLAGFESPNVSVTYCLYELALNPEMQKRLQEEIDKTTESSGNITYEDIMEMEYLDMVIDETLRKHTPVSFLNRICTKDFPIPESNFTIPKGMRVLISPIGIYHNPEFFKDPEKFDPSRYNKNDADNKRNFIDLKFGEGPRNCIGKNLGIIQVKFVVALILLNYNISMIDKLDEKIKFNTHNIMQKPDKMYLYFEKRKKEPKQ